MNKLQAIVQPKLLSDLMSGIGAYAKDVTIQGICDDTRLLRAGDAFLCLPRVKDIPARIAEAKAKGAVAVIIVGQHENLTDLACACLPHMEAAGALLRRWFETEHTTLKVFGITGTDGKTSSTWMLREILAKQLGSAWSCGTLGFVRDLDHITDLGNTTPSLLTLHTILAMAHQQNIGALVLEVSSHGIAQQRIAGLSFSAAIWTTLGQDHLEDHGGLAAYVEAKASFARLVLAAGGKVIANADYANIRDALGEGAAQALWYANNKSGLDADLLWSREDGVLLLKKHKASATMAHVPLADFHAENLAALMLLMTTVFDLPLASLAAKLDGVMTTPLGRLEPVDANQRIFIDYAHTAEGLQRSLQSARELCVGRLLLVFGCGGDRDKAKRPAMGAVAAQFADEAWLTSDNPRSETQTQIAADVLQGIPAAFLQYVHVCEDRKLSIFQAVSAASAQDMVVIAGKGHESYMEIQGAKLPWSDRATALAATLAVGEKQCA